eukprot:COSAG02_NODE_1322_length_13259_cov_71.269985_5_plen_103_part_00
MQSCGITATTSSGDGGGTTSSSYSLLAKCNVQQSGVLLRLPGLPVDRFLKADSGLPHRAVWSAGEDGAEMHTLESSASLLELETAPVGLVEACCIPFGPCGS